MGEKKGNGKFTLVLFFSVWEGRGGELYMLNVDCGFWFFGFWFMIDSRR